MADSQPSTSSAGYYRLQPSCSPRYHFDPETMAPFRIMRLPMLPRRNIMKQWTVSQILELTMTSQKFKASTNFCDLKLDFYKVTFANFSNIISIFNENCGLKLYVCCEHTELEKATWSEKRINGEKIMMTEPDRIDEIGRTIKSPEIKVFAETADQKWELLEKLRNYITSVFKFERFGVNSYRGWDQRNKVIWNLKPRIEKITIDVPWERNPGNYPWMSFDTILSTETTCKRFKFDFHVYPSVAINRMFKEWIAGKNEDLEDIVFHFSNHTHTRNHAPCLEGIATQKTFYEAKKCDYHRLQPYFLRIPIVDVKRATDGRLATIMSDKHNIGLYVWHEKHLVKYREAIARWEAEKETNGPEELEEERYWN